MINRELIRLKVVQLIYAFYQNEGKSVDTVLKELDFSLGKAYELYLFLLTLIVETAEQSLRFADTKKAHDRRLGLTNNEVSPYETYAHNAFILQLRENETLIKYREKEKREWDNENVAVRKLLSSIIESDIFLSYNTKDKHSYEEDRELVRKIYKNFMCDNDELNSLIEENGIYWNDDKCIIDSFIIKTIKKFSAENGSKQELLPPYNDESDHVFARQLLSETIKRSDEVRNLIRENCKNWEFERLAFMDVIISQVALTEMLTFRNIPLSVTFNEYLNIANFYSTPKSSAYINGLLDHTAKQLKEKGLLFKS